MIRMLFEFVHPNACKERKARIYEALRCTYNNATFDAKICLLVEPDLHLLPTLQKTKYKVLRKHHFSVQPQDFVGHINIEKCASMKRSRTAHDRLCHNPLDFSGHLEFFSQDQRGLLS